MTMRYIGRCKENTRIIDFKRNKDGMYQQWLKLSSMIRNRSARIVLLFTLMVKRDILLLLTWINKVGTLVSENAVLRLVTLPA